MNRKKQKIIITGVSSFIGSKLAIFFKKINYEVIGTISKEINSYEGIRLKRIELMQSKDVEILKVDIERNGNLKSLINNNPPDFFIHHAAWTQNMNSSDFDSIKSIKVNVLPLRELYQTLFENSVKGIIITGTNQEYGDQESSCKEDDLCMPTTKYGLSKLAQIITSYQLSMEYNLPTRIARVFNPVGSLDNPQKLIPTMVKRICSNQIMEMSDCNQKRDFIYIGDLIAGYNLLLKDFDRKLFDIFNLSSGEAISVKDLIVGICSKLEKDADLLYFGAKKMRIGEPMVSYGCNKKAKEILGWNPPSIMKRLEKITSEIKND